MADPTASADSRPEPSDDRGMFLRYWLRDPWRIAAIAPSGASLARLITSRIDPSHAPVIELGAGTGSFTRALLERGIPGRRLALVEEHPAFVRILRNRFPDARVLAMDATALAEVEPFVGESAGAAVSGLPILSMPMHTASAVLNGVFRHMRTNAALYQFTYGLRCPLPRRLLDRLGLDAERVGWTAANLPPATVYRISRLGETFLRSSTEQ